ncbi:MAG: fibrobacter succinogenes major paralogous domain-containing protein [Bacteroidaceae bacterium]|nr:fibrobacter succinogenes major paralogous domain-containing protein [Bacteroidaceae bacterium]
MNKKILFFLLMLFAFSYSSTAQVKKVAILPLRDIRKEVEPGKILFIRSSISTAIMETPGYEAYTRINLDAIMNEQDFQRNGLVSDNEIHKIGEMTGAGLVLDAVVAPFDQNTLTVDAKLINVESAKIENESVEIVHINDIEQIKTDCHNLTKKLLKSSNADKLPESKPVTTQSQSSVREGFVDMGLSVKWAECNIGASSPEQYGNYYSWGETSTKSVYNKKSYGYLNNPSVLPLSRDIANVKLGGSCRMPTNEEWKELIEKCDWTWMQYKGVYGYRVEADNGNCIFLPAAGYRYNDGLYFAGSYGYYWSSSLSTSDSYNAYELFFNSGSHNRRSNGRYYGRSVRPVCP